jgi:hypothetical protein
MKRPFKQIFLLFFAFSFAISIVDCMLNDKVSFHEQIFSSTECADFPIPSDDSHVNHLDDVFYLGSEIQSKKDLNYLELYSIFSGDLKSNYQTSIWQPPKRA